MQLARRCCGHQVKVGSYSDPPELPGLAHFTEYMLFYGSEKYPEEDDYMKFVQVLCRQDCAIC